MRGLKFISWADTTGYAIAGKGYVKALMREGVPLTWTPMLTGTGAYEPWLSRSWPADPELAPVCNAPLDYDTVLIHTVPEYYPGWLAQERKPGRRILGYTVWELDTLPAHWPAILNQLDGVLVPSTWNVDIFRRSGVTVPLHVVPHLSQFEFSPPPSPAQTHQLLERIGGPERVAQRFIFYTIGFWSTRKAPHLALQAYWQAFGANDPVLMVMKTTRNDFTRWHRHWRQAFRLRHPPVAQTVERLVRHHPGRAPVALIAQDDLPDGEMQALHALGNCFVSLTRTEGWGLGAFDAARLGKPVVMTGYGGQTDFLQADSSWLVQYDLIPVKEPIWSANYRPQDRWAQPDVDQAASMLRDIAFNRSAALERAAGNATHIASHYGRTAVVHRLLEALAP